MSVSGGLEFVYEDVFSLKKQRHRACDTCRQVKRRCDGNPVCSHCAKCNIVCTYVQPIGSRPRRPRNSRDIDQPLSPEYGRYVKELKERLQDVKAGLDHIEQRPTKNSKPSFIDNAITYVTKPSIPPHSDGSKVVDIAENLQSLSLDCSDHGFQGQSSAAVLVDLAAAVKPTHAAQGTISGLNFSAPSLKPPEVSPHNLFFPEEHLMKSLISHYFSNVNVFLPLLHRSRFLESLKERLHFHHHGFASTLLLVCALGSLYLYDISAKEAQKLAWMWYDQVELCGHSPRQRPTLYDLQAYCLAAEFLYLTSKSRFCWSIVGFGLRVGEDIGAHRQRNRTTSITMEEELEKRAMWILLMLDTHLGDTLGRVRVVNQCDMDMVLPCEFEDDSEIWGPEHNKPQVRPTAFFISFLTLSRILQFTLSILYCNTMDREMTGIADTKIAMAELESALNGWLTQVPQYLRWHADCPEGSMSDHTAALACLYYHTQVLIYRSSLCAVPVAPLDHLAREMCTKAARACIRVADGQRHRNPEYPPFFSQNPLFTAAMILVIDIDQGYGTAQDLALVHTAIENLASQQLRWPSSGFFVTVLRKFVSSVPSAESGHSISNDRIHGFPEHFTTLFTEFTHQKSSNDSARITC